MADDAVPGPNNIETPKACAQSQPVVDLTVVAESAATSLSPAGNNSQTDKVPGSKEPEAKGPVMLPEGITMEMIREFVQIHSRSNNRNTLQDVTLVAATCGIFTVETIYSTITSNLRNSDSFGHIYGEGETTLGSRSDIPEEVCQIFHNIRFAESRSMNSKLWSYLAAYKLHVYLADRSVQIRDEELPKWQKSSIMGSHTSKTIGIAIDQFLCLWTNKTMEELEVMKTEQKKEFRDIKSAFMNWRAQGSKVNVIIGTFGSIGAILIWPMAQCRIKAGLETWDWTVCRLTALLDTIREMPNYQWMQEISSYISEWIEDWLAGRISGGQALEQLERFQLSHVGSSVNTSIPNKRRREDEGDSGTMITDNRRYPILFSNGREVIDLS